MFWDELLQTERPTGQAFWPVSDGDGAYRGLEDLEGRVHEVRPFFSEQHPVDALGLLTEHRVDAVAVVDRDLALLGGLSAERLSQWMGSQWCFQLEGSSLWLQGAQTLSGTWIQALEAEGYRVVAMATDYSAEAAAFGTWLRLDQPDPTAAVETLERLGATVLGSYPPGRRHDDARENLDHLIHYLNL